MCLNGVSENRDVFIKRSRDGLERPQSDAPVYPAVGLRSTYPNGSFGNFADIWIKYANL